MSFHLGLIFLWYRWKAQADIVVVDEQSTDYSSGFYTNTNTFTASAYSNQSQNTSTLG